ncbi:MAG: hypothetical protein KAJ79_02660 [Candidatus Omnitrophica bacterium]|nr:hypothetical protein [Candidatus Omnitrophota bacterium]
MLNGDEFVDSIMSGEFDILFPKRRNKQFLCFHCGLTIFGYEIVKWINKPNGVFSCNNCGETLSI